MSDDLDEAARVVSRAGNHALAERLFGRSYRDHGDPHSGVNVVFERYLQDRATADEVAEAVRRYGLADTRHGRWLLEQVRR